MFPIPLRIRAPKTQPRNGPHETTPILDYLQVTHTKSNIFKQKG